MRSLEACRQACSTKDGTSGASAARPMPRAAEQLGERSGVTRGGEGELDALRGEFLAGTQRCEGDDAGERLLGQEDRDRRACLAWPVIAVGSMLMAKATGIARHVR
nr:hypothetical protein [Streptomyces sp. Ag109_G2-15]